MKTKTKRPRYTVAFWVASDSISSVHVKHYHTKKAARAAKLEPTQNEEITKYIFRGALDEEAAAIKILD